MANDSIRGRQVVVRLTNKSGGGVVEGDVVIIDSTTAASFTTTTTAGLNTDIIGVVLETIAGDAIGRVCISGYVPKITLSGAASLGDTFATHTVAKQAARSASRGAGSFGEVLGTGTTPAALLWGLPDAIGAGGVASDSIWDAAGDLVIGTGANSGDRLAIGTANQILRVNSTATAPEWANGGMIQISDTTLSGTGTFDLTSIPQTYTHLIVQGILQPNNAVGADPRVRMAFNADTTWGNYTGARTYWGSGAGSGAEGAGAIGPITAAAGIVANLGTYIWIWIPWYRSTAFKKVAWSKSVVFYAAGSYVQEFYSVWATYNTAISRITLDVNEAGNQFAIGSRVTLHGII